MKSDCLFCNIPRERIIAENELFYAVRDGFPVTELHTLIIPKRHVKNYFELSSDELIACNKIIMLSKNKIEKDQTIEGFNLGTNCGKAAGQSINHCHIHLIPRREGDVENPQGGVRAVISSMQHYIRKSK